MEDDKVLAAVTEKLQQASSGTAQMALEMHRTYGPPSLLRESCATK
jgi:hypothetical protein